MRIQDELPVLIRTTRGQSPDPVLTEQLESEYGTLRNICIPGVLKAHDLVVSSDSAALVLEDPGGLLLDAVLVSKRMDISEFLHIAILITSIIADLHSQRIVHTRLQTGVVLLGKDGQGAWISGFEHALKLKAAAHSRHILAEGNLAYIAPEQTGCMDADIDYRDNEVDATHPLHVVMRELREAGVNLREIELKPLDMISVSRIIQDTVGRSDSVVSENSDSAKNSAHFLVIVCSSRWSIL